jgi:hypothetical protein
LDWLQSGLENPSLEKSWLNATNAFQLQKHQLNQDGWYVDKKHSCISCTILTMMVGYEETGFGVILFLDGIGCHVLTPHFVLLISRI